MKRGCMALMLVLPILGASGCFDCLGVIPTDFEDFEAGADVWRQDTDECFGFRIAGACADQRIVFFKALNVDASRTLYFNAESGGLIGSSSTGPFRASTSLPALLCGQGAVTEVFCGDFYEVGDAITP